MKPGQSLSGSYLEGNEFLKQKGYKDFYDAYAAVKRGELDKNTFDTFLEYLKRKLFNVTIVLSIF